MRLHHIGYVVANIDQALKSMIVGALINRVHDPLQNAELALFEAGGAFIELIQPLNESAFTWRSLQQGGGFHHLCYQAGSIESVERALIHYRMVKIRGPIDALLFGGQQVVFAVNRNREVVEFVIAPESFE